MGTRLVGGEIAACQIRKKYAKCGLGTQGRGWQNMKSKCHIWENVLKLWCCGAQFVFL